MKPHNMHLSSSYFNFFLINERKRKRDEKHFHYLIHFQPYTLSVQYRRIKRLTVNVITKRILIGAPDPNWMTTEMKK